MPAQAAESVASEPQWVSTLVTQNARLSACADLNGALDTILETSIALLGADFGNVQLYDRDSRSLTIVVQRGFDDAFMQAFHTVSAADGCACGRALVERHAVVVPDVETDSEFAPYRGIAAAAGFRATQSTPLISSTGEVVGVLSTHFRRPHRPSPDEMRMLALYADHAAEMVLHFQREAALKTAEARQRLLLHELSHRFKNMLAVIQVIARESLKHAASAQDFAAALDGRLRAIDRAQGLLIRTDSDEADLRALVDEQLMLVGNEDQVSCRGPKVLLTASESLNLGLLLYELGTNARKHGALSSDKGRVDIEWAIAGSGNRSQRGNTSGQGGTVLDLYWIERGGPRVTEPTRSGFGSTLLRYFGAAGGESRVDYAPTGLVCRLKIGLHDDPPPT